MNKKTISIIVIIIILGVAGWYLTRKNSFTPQSNEFQTGNGDMAQETNQEATDTNALVIKNQEAGSSIMVSKAVLKESGYVVFYGTTETGEIGPALFASPLLPVGENKNVKIDVPTKTETTYFVVLHKEDKSEGYFSSVTDDPPVFDEKGEKIIAKFKVE